MNVPTTQILTDGAKNCAVKITGVEIPAGKWYTIVDTRRFGGQCKRVKIDHAEWAVTAGIEVFLAWAAEEGERELIFPLGGRGQITFADYGGLSNLSEGKSGHIELMVQSRLSGPSKLVEAFTLFVDMQKQ
jgi:hypothetical protein